MAIWNDGRSGIAGAWAGNRALDTIAHTEGPINKIRGTIFDGANEILIGRVCGNDEYLHSGVLHWANTSWDQHCDLDRDAQSAGKQLTYLFVTASDNPPTVEYWRVPAPIVRDGMVERKKDRRGPPFPVHIIELNGPHLLA